MAEIKCPSCGSPNVEQVDTNKYQCPYCGKTFSQEVAVPQQPQPAYQPQPQQPSAPLNTSGKNKTTAAILAILLGGLGVHHFYLGHTGKGILYILFCWTYIPSIVGLIEGIIYLTQSDEEFARKQLS